MVGFRRRRGRSIADTAAEPLLSVDRLTVRFGGIIAVSDLDLDVEDGSIVALIGPNGAGKTTAFNCISGFQRSTRGTVRLDGIRVVRRDGVVAAWAIVTLGLVVGLMLAAAAIDVDGLWRAVVVRPSAAGDPFSLQSVARGLRSYFRWELAVDRVGTSWRVVTADGREVVAVRRTRQEAVALRDSLQAAVAARRMEAGTVPEGEESDESVATTPAIADDVLDRVAAGKWAIRSRGWLALACGWLAASIGAAIVRNRSRRSPEFVVAAGIARTFQNIRLFRGLTVLENVLVGVEWGRRRSSSPSEGVAEARRLLDFVGLDKAAERTAGGLPYGEQRRLEIARALATSPRLLLLDEPAAGMNPTETAAMAQVIARIRGMGIAVLLIEHQLSVVMRVSDRVSVLDHGVKIAEGTPDEIRRDERVIAVYLGESG